jgi:hypothetical protein
MGRQEMGIFLFTTPTRPALGPIQPCIQWITWTLSLGVNLPGREADHSPPSSAEVKESLETYFHSPNTPSWRGAQLKHRDKFTLNFYITTEVLSHDYGKMAVNYEYERLLGDPIVPTSSR